MADPRETVVFRWLAAGDAGDFDAFDDLLHADGVVHAPLGLSTESAEAEKAIWKDALAAIPDLRHDVQRSWRTAMSKWRVSLSPARWLRVLLASRAAGGASESIRP